MIPDMGKRCPDCGGSYAKLGTHWAQAHGQARDVAPIACPDCGRTYRGPAALGTHRAAAHLAVDSTCPDCGQVCASSRALAVHQGKMHRPVAVVACPDCGQACKGGTGLASHRAQSHGDGELAASRVRTRAASRRQNGAPVICPECGGTFKRSGLAAHVRFAHRAVESTCLDCGEVFAGVLALGRHRGEVHGDVLAPVPCPACGELFAGTRGLGVHREIAHQLGEPVACPVCGEAFAHARACGIHRRATHDPTSREPVDCPTCGQTCEGERGLAIHAGKIHDADRTEIACTSCGRAFTAVGLVHHRRLTGADPTTGEHEPAAPYGDGWTATRRRLLAAGLWGELSCYLCGESIDVRLGHPDPLSASIDHVIPRARGGTHDAANLRPTHLRCNLRKHARADVGPLAYTDA
jgi:hypothetical protein